MDIPSNLLKNSIKEGNVYYFASTKINSSEPHYYVCIKKTDNDILIMSCCTSKYDTSYKYIQRNNLPLETLVYLDPQKNSFLSTKTYINCNSYIDFTIDDFLSKYTRGEIKLKGEINKDDYHQIVNGLIISPDIEEELKETLRTL